jgi:hypothetical protein
MWRRQFLGGLAGVGGLAAGCLTAPRADGEATSRATPLAEHGFPPSICREEPLEDVGVRGIRDPTTASDWSGIDVPQAYRLPDEPGLTAESTIIGLETGGQARAYPLRILHRLEVVNDHLGEPLLVTFCPLCNTGMAASRVVDGSATVFRLSGLLWQPPGVRAALSRDEGRVVGTSRAAADAAIRRTGNLVMVDDGTGSYWSQFLGRAICGPAAGKQLAVRAATTTTWADWQNAYPETDVLLPPPYSTPIE